MPPALVPQAPAALDSPETVWVFDLDNTLYPERCNLFAHIDRNMGLYISRLLKVGLAEAKRVQKEYFLTHGTTLKGLIDVHGVNPKDFLDFVHDIDLSALAEDAELKAALGALQGRKVVFTNGSAEYAARVLGKIGIADALDGIHDIGEGNFVPKPDPKAYHALARRFAFAPGAAVMIEDMARNLTPAAEMGMTTVWLNTGYAYGRVGHDPRHIHYEIKALAPWLKTCAGGAHARP
ncbi:MAG TPA: pyrimidine 5'-nucleotidase [Sphingomonadales bacterium]|nr:pyrimidine 5'-nucleotidase [Sphingomonadales bacterium]